MKNEFELCELYKLIPKDKIDRVFQVSKTASSELDCTFLGFEEVYRAVTLFVQKDRIIIDFGCGYAFQSWYFKDYRKYIGVDVGHEAEDVLNVLETGNSDFYNMRIQQFIAMFPRMGYEPEEVFAICSYVPDTDAQRLVRETFPHCLVYYPHRS